MNLNGGNVKAGRVKMGSEGSWMELSSNKSNLYLTSDEEGATCAIAQLELIWALLMSQLYLKTVVECECSNKSLILENSNVTEGVYRVDCESAHICLARCLPCGRQEV